MRQILKSVRYLCTYTAQTTILILYGTKLFRIQIQLQHRENIHLIQE